MQKENKKIQYFIALSVSLASVTLGTSSAWPTPVIPKFYDNSTSIKITESETTWMLVMSSPGFMAGSLATRFLSDKYGRRTTILASAVPIALGTIIVASAVKAWQLLITRFLWGCGTGIVGTVITMYIAEISSKDIRGTLSVGTRIMFNLGTLVTMAIGPFVSYEVLNYMLLGLPVCYFVGCWWIPESPYYYLKEGKVAEAKIVLNRLRKYDSDKDLEDDLALMQADVKKEMMKSSTFLELLTGKEYRKALIISCGLKITQIMTGTMTIQQYLGRIMVESKSTMKLGTVLIVFGVVKFVIGMMSSILVDRVGRRPLLIYSFFGTSFSLALVGIYFFMQEVLHIDQATLGPYGMLAFVGIILANIISTIGFYAVIMLLPAEIFPLNIKAVALTCLNILGGVLSFIVTMMYQYINDVSGLCGVFWSFAVVSFLGAWFSILFVPETKGKSLREILVMLQGSVYEDSQNMAPEYDDKLNDVEVKEVRT